MAPDSGLIKDVAFFNYRAGARAGLYSIPIGGLWQSLLQYNYGVLQAAATGRPTTAYGGQLRYNIPARRPAGALLERVRCEGLKDALIWFDIAFESRYSVDGGKMVFIETTVFTRQLLDLLGDEEYLRLQERLAKNPEEGVLIGGTGGLRKIRLGRARSGKRGGLRIIYYWHAKSDILLLLARSEERRVGKGGRSRWWPEH